MNYLKILLDKIGFISSKNLTKTECEELIKLRKISANLTYNNLDEIIYYCFIKKDENKKIYYSCEILFNDTMCCVDIFSCSIKYIYGETISHLKAIELVKEEFKHILRKQKIDKLLNK